MYFTHLEFVYEVGAPGWLSRWSEWLLIPGVASSNPTLGTELP